MAINYSGSLYWGPGLDTSRYYSYTGPTLPANQSWTLFWTFRLHHCFGGTNPFTSSPLTMIPWGNTIGNGLNGTDVQLNISVANYASAAAALKPSFRIARSGVAFLAVGNFLTSSTALDRNKVYTLAVRYNQPTGNMEMILCEKGGSANVVASSAANSTFVGSSRALGTLNIGGSWANEIQTVGFVNRLVTDSEIGSIAGGTELESVIESGARTALLILDSPASAISATWGSSNATQVGTWTNRPTSSAILSTAGSTYLSCDEPLPFQPFGLAPNSSTATCSFSGTYNGFTPSSVEGRVVKFDGTVVVDWTSLSGFTATAGSWFGNLTVSEGTGLVLQLRDGADHTKSWSGSHPWMVCPVACTIGQSPHTIFESSYSGVSTLSGEGYTVALVNSKMEMWQATAAGVGAGYCETFNQFSAASGGKVLFLIPASVAGTSSTQWAAKTTGLWDRMLSLIDFTKSRNLGLYWQNGAGDVGTASATIKSNHDTIITNLDSDLQTSRATTYRYTLIPYNRDNSGSPQAVRRAQVEWALGNVQYGSKVFRGYPCQDIPLDGEHSGVATASTSNTITLAASGGFPSRNDIPNNYPNSITVSDDNGTQTKTVTAYSSTTKVATISGTFSPSLTGTISYIASGPTPHEGWEGSRRMGQRFGQELAFRHGYTLLSPEGPTISTATYPVGGDGSIIDVRVLHKHGSNLRTKNSGISATNVYGFDVSEDSFSNLKTLSSTVITGPNSVRITLSAPPANKANLVVRYMNGFPVTGPNFPRIEDGLYDDNGVGVQSGSPVWPTFDSLAVTREATTYSEVGSGGSIMGGLSPVQFSGLVKSTGGAFAAGDAPYDGGPDVFIAPFGVAVGSKADAYRRSSHIPTGGSRISGNAMVQLIEPEIANGGVRAAGRAAIRLVKAILPSSTSEKGMPCLIENEIRRVTWKRVRGFSGADAYVAASTVCSSRL